MSIQASGSGSVIDVSGLTSFGTYNGLLSVTQSGTVLDTGLTSLNNVTVQLDGTGTLAVSQWQSLTNGGLTISGGDYAPTAGAATSFNAFTSLSDIDDSSVNVTNGSLALPDVTSYSTNYNEFYATDYSGSEPVTISLPNLTSIGGNGLFMWCWGTDAVMNLPSLESMSNVYLHVIFSGELIDPSLTTMSGGQFQIAYGGKVAVSQLQSYTGGDLSITGANYSPTSHGATALNSFTSLSNINGSGLYVSGGGSLTLPAVTNEDPEGRDIAFAASGAGAVLNLPNLMSVSRSSSGGGYTSHSGYYSRGSLNFKATGGGQVQAPALASVTAGDQQTAVGAQAQGTGSLVNLSGLTTFVTYNGLLSATQGGTILLNSGLTSLESTRFTVDGTGEIITPTDSVSLDQFTTLNYDYINVEGGTYDLPNLTNIDNTGVSVSGGGSLTLPNVGTYTNNEYYGGTFLSAVDTTSGGTLALPGLTTIASTYPVNISAAGSNSVIDLPALTSWTVTNLDGYYSGYQSDLSVTQGATVNDGSLTTLGNVNVTLDGTGKLGVGSWQSLTDGDIRITGGDYSPTSGSATSSNAFTNLSDIDGSSLYVSGGGSLTLPAVQSYTNDDTGNAVFQATDTTSGGTIDLPGLTAISGYDGASIEAAGSNSAIDLPALTSWTITNPYGYSGYQSDLSVTQGATVEDGALTTLGDVSVTMDGTGKLGVSSWQSLTDGRIRISGGDYSPTSGSATSSNAFTNLSDIDGSSLYVSGGGSLTLPALQSYTNDDVYGAAFQATDTTSGGTINLPGLTSISGYYGASIEAAGAEPDRFARPQFARRHRKLLRRRDHAERHPRRNGQRREPDNSDGHRGGPRRDRGARHQPVAECHRRRHQGHRGRLLAHVRRGDIGQRVHRPEHDRRVEPLCLRGRQPDPARRPVLHQQ